MIHKYNITSQLLSSLAVLSFLVGCASIGNDNNLANEQNYFDQKTPGLVAERFAPGVVSTEHRDLSAFFSPDMKEFYFTRRDNSTKKWSLHSYKFKDNSWQLMAIEPRIGRPFISPDNNIMHLGKKYKKRTQSGWSEVTSLGSPYAETWVMKLTSSLQGTYVYDEATRDGTGTLRYSRIINGKREEPKPLDKSINTGKWNAHPFIAPDESYILWDGERENGFGGNDIHISFKQKDGRWGKAINLGTAVNTDAEDAGPYVTPDGKFLFFNRNGDVYWISTKIFESLNSAGFLRLAVSTASVSK